jgi:polygalacturonase
MSRCVFLATCAAILAIAPIAPSAAAPVPALAGATPRVIQLPHIPARIFSITRYGAAGDGATDCTSAIKKAVAACSGAGGGTVLVPAGHYLTRPFMLASNIDLRLDAGATLLMSEKPADYASPSGKLSNCIEAANCHDVAITGNGTIDGQGSAWWPRYVKSYVPPAGSAPLPHRPFMVVLSNCTRVLVDGVTLQNSPSFHLVPDQCHDVTIRNVRISAPQDSPNTDGIDPSGWNYVVTGCKIDVGDDCIAVKPGHLQADSKPSCTNFTIADCTFLHGHGMSIGGQTRGGLDGMLVRDCTFDSTEAGIRMKSSREAGGLVENVCYENLKMVHVGNTIMITSYYPKIPKKPGTDPAQPVTARTPIYRHIRIDNVVSTNSESAGAIIGLPEAPITDIVLTNVHISAAKGMRVCNAQQVTFASSSISCKDTQAIETENADVTGIDLVTGGIKP